MSIQYAERSATPNQPIEAQIIGYLEKTVSKEEGGELNTDTPLLESGILDSLGIMQLMMFLSETMQIDITDEDFIPENFETVGSLTDFVVNKQIS